jgi:enoyl-CoA hydratase
LGAAHLVVARRCCRRRDAGPVAEAVQEDQTLDRALALADAIAAKSPLAVRLAKEAMLRSFETGLQDGEGYFRFPRQASSFLSRTLIRSIGEVLHV